MPKGVPRLGYRRTRKLDTPSIEECERRLALRVPTILEELEKLTKPITCPHCGNQLKVIDKDVGIYLVNRVMGMPKQRTEVDITQQIVLSGDQIDVLIERYEIATRAIEGEVKLLEATTSQNGHCAKGDD